MSWRLTITCGSPVNFLSPNETTTFMPSTLPIPERDAFVRSICENLDDDTSRLAFADWLQEHGEDAQAEFIRLQIASARHAPRAGHDLGEEFDAVLAMDAKAAKLLAVHCKDWLPPCPVCGGTGDDGGHAWDRGMKGECKYCKAAGHIGECCRGLPYSVSVRLEDAFTPVLAGDHAEHAAHGDYRPSLWALNTLRQFPTIERVFLNDQTPFDYCGSDGRIDPDSWQWWDSTSPSAQHDLTGDPTGYLIPLLFNRLWQDWVPQRLHGPESCWLRFSSLVDANDALAEAAANIIRESLSKIVPAHA